MTSANTTAPCVHHWIIETPNGPTSCGRCRRCGAEKQHRNFIAESNWSDFANSFLDDGRDRLRIPK